MLRRQNFALNPQLYMEDNVRSIIKSPQNVGRLYSRILKTNFQQSGQSLNLHNQNNQQPLKQQFIQQSISGLRGNHSLYMQTKNNQWKNMSKQQFLQMTPITNKSFRINKISSNNSNNVLKFKKRQKTPQLIGKLSQSKLKIQQKDQSSKINKNEQSIKITKQNNKSPGYLTSRKSIPSKSKIFSLKQSIETSRFGQSTPQTQRQKINIFSDVNNDQNGLIQQVKQKETYLKNLIQKHRRQNIKMIPNMPIPRKNIQDFKYNYPVGRNGTKNQKRESRDKQNLSPYIQKIQQNSKGLKSYISASKHSGTSVSKQSSGLNRISSVTKSKASAIQKQKIYQRKIGCNQESILQKSRAVQMRISPQVNISFSVLTAHNKQLQSRAVLQNQVSIQEEQRNILKQKDSQVSVYTPQKNKYFNNRRPKIVNSLIDPIPQELYQSLNSKAKINLLKFSEYFSRNKPPIKNNQNLEKDNQIPINNNPHNTKIQSKDSTQNQQLFTINMRTKISSIKQLLIQSGQKINVHINLPSIIFENKFIHNNVELKDLHWFIEKVYHEIEVKPQIISIKQYKNALFTGVLQTTPDEIYNTFSTIIYHFNNAIYVGDWKQHKNQQVKEQTPIEGFKNGIGMQMIYRDSINEQNKQQNIVIEVYYGQFQNNLKQGYGVRFILTFKKQENKKQSQCLNQLISIGCWKDNQKHGWAKTYQNRNIIENAQYDHNKLIKCRGNNNLSANI